MSIPSRDNIAGIVNFVFAYVSLNFPDVLKICIKTKNFKHIHTQLEDAFKLINIPMNLGIYIFDGVHSDFTGSIKDVYNLASCSEMLLACSMNEDPTLTLQDYMVLMNHKDNTIKNLVMSKIGLETIQMENTNIINSLKNEIAMLKIENERIKNDNIRVKTESLAYRVPPPGLNLSNKPSEYEKYLSIKKIWDREDNNTN